LKKSTPIFLRGAEVFPPSLVQTIFPKREPATWISALGLLTIQHPQRCAAKTPPQDVAVAPWARRLAMKSFLVVAFFTVLLTGYSLAEAGWFQPDASQPEAGATPVATSQGAQTTDIARDGGFREAEWSWRTNQPRHWHACLLQK
jgi:hypothetical protein